MLSFEEKKAAFHSFKLKEKKISNGRVNFVYPESRQRGQILATQLHPSGNGYVTGKYMSDKIIYQRGYKVDPRGWISIKDFSEDELKQVISEAMKSMAWEHDAEVKSSLSNEQKADESDIPLPLDEKMEAFKNSAALVKERELAAVAPVVVPEGNREQPKDDASLKALEQYPCSYMFFWVGLTLSTMEMGSLMWRSAIRRIGDKRREGNDKPKYFGRLFLSHS